MKDEGLPGLQRHKIARIEPPVLEIAVGARFGNIVFGYAALPHADLSDFTRRDRLAVPPNDFEGQIRRRETPRPSGKFSC